MLADLSDRVMREYAPPEVLASAEAGEFPTALWRRIEETGLSAAMLPESQGGSDASLEDAGVILRLAGRFALPVPLAETMLAGLILAKGDVPLPAGPVTLAPSALDEPLELLRTRHGWTLRGHVSHVPWARASGHIAAIASLGDGRQAAVVVPTPRCSITPFTAVSGEPRDGVSFDAAIEAGSMAELPPESDHAAALFALGALARCHQMTGAMEWILERCCAYAEERVQFGRRIGAFQAVQQLIAVLAGQVSAAAMATDSATLAHGTDGSDQAIAYAKARVGEAAGEVAAIAHQTHGAMGYSYEYSLHFRTRRLWTWRDEFGGDRYWQLVAGRRLARGGAGRLWQDITE